jgi:gamma-glutamyl hercynylcysteine S-oxide synthase
MTATATRLQSRSQNLQLRLAEARRRTDELFALVRPVALYERPIPQRHRLIFYLGHVEAFDWNLLAHRAFGLAPFHPVFDKLLAFGIDPVDSGLPSDTEADWPKREEIEYYNRQVRQKLDEALGHTLQHPGDDQSNLFTMVETAIEHRLMHLETLAYLLHRLAPEKKVYRKEKAISDGLAVEMQMIEIPPGSATLGLKRVSGEEFGWDNEFEAHEVQVPAFAIQDSNVTNREFLEFMEAGGYENEGLWSGEAQEWKKREGIEHPGFWRRAGNLWMYRTMFGEIRLPLEWPVYVSHAEATAYANWLGRKLPSEAEFHRAAYGTLEGTAERAYPWGDENPGAEHGNFNFQGSEPLAVGSKPRGASAFGVQDLVGNGWEWTRTKLEPFEGFAPREFYPGYSADFFDGKHYVMKGGSPRTAACMLRRSFRNWFQPYYPYVYATFRCVAS